MTPPYSLYRQLDDTSSVSGGSSVNSGSSGMSDGQQERSQQQETHSTSSQSPPTIDWLLISYDILFQRDYLINERLEWWTRSGSRLNIASNRRNQIVQQQQNQQQRRRRRRREIITNYSVSLFVLLFAITLPFLSILVVNKLLNSFTTTSQNNTSS